MRIRSFLNNISMYSFTGLKKYETRDKNNYQPCGKQNYLLCHSMFVVWTWPILRGHMCVSYLKFCQRIRGGINIFASKLSTCPKWVSNTHGTFSFFSAGTDFSRQNLTSIDVRFWRLRSTPALKEYRLHNTDIQIRRKELTETFMMISNWKNLWSHGLF